ncbi:hypothetical protein CVD08_19150, partial [Acinetobacter seifertii]
SHPMVPTKLVSCPSFLRIDEFTDNFFKILISNRESPLYRELKDNQNFNHQKGYIFEPENYILRHFFLDCQKAIDAMIWQPTGNYICKYIKEQEGVDNFYNTDNDSFSYSDERWNCKVFVGIEFFNVMVTSAIYQKKQDHMWLTYYEHFLDEILKNIDRKKKSEVWQEFPLKFDYLIYCLISNCSTWVKAGIDLYKNQLEIIPIEEAAYCLGSLLRKILFSVKIDNRQKIYYLGIILKTMRELDIQKQTRLSQKIFCTLVRNFRDDARDSDISWLRDIYSQVDQTLRLSGSTFDKEIKKAP